jgi:hypothetical protein
LNAAADDSRSTIALHDRCATALVSLTNTAYRSDGYSERAMTRWFGLTMAIIICATLLASVTGCERRPGYNAYGRYSGTSDTTADRLKNYEKDEWYKDRGM